MTDRQGYGGQPQQGHGQQYGQREPWQAGQQPTRPLYGPPGGPRGRKPWPARHKALCGFLVFCALMLIVGIAAAACSSPSSSTPVAAVSLKAGAHAGTASPAAKEATAAARTVTTAPAQTTHAPPPTQAQTAAAYSPAPTTPAQTTPAASPAPPASTAPASCYPLSDEGTCYEPGEYCRETDHGKSGVAGDGQAITCEDNDGWRWEPS